MNNPMTEERFAFIVDDLLETLQNEPRETFLTFVGTPKENLIAYHHGLGRTIRNKYSLWELSWEPMIENGADASPDHPDAVSMRIIGAVWDKAREEII